MREALAPGGSGRRGLVFLYPGTSEARMDLVIETSQRRPSYDLAHDLRVERIAFAAKVRSARAVLGLSQDQFARQIGLTQNPCTGSSRATSSPSCRPSSRSSDSGRSRGSLSRTCATVASAWWSGAAHCSRVI